MLEKIEPSADGEPLSGVKISCADAQGNPAYWFRYLDLQTDYSAMRAAIPWQDATTTEAASIANGVRLLRPNLWETIITLVISQGMSAEKTRATVTRMCAALGDLCGGPFGVYRAFPGPDSLYNAKAWLKSLGLGYRARYVSNIARLVLEGEICLDYLRTADYTEARTYLKSIDGIGERIASLICLYGLGMREAFPADANFKKIVASKYDGRFPVELYGTNRGVAWLYVTTADRMERGRGK